jgi:hypothetical protein
MIHERTFVRVSRRHGDGHEIEHTVVFDSGEVRIEAPLDQFLIALAEEVGDIGVAVKKWYGTKHVPSDLSKKLLDAAPAIIQEMKEQTKY